MQLPDTLYGTIVLPDYIEPLIHTDRMVRIRNITQAVLPNDLMVTAAIPSRFRHSLGVAYLATIAAAHNDSIAQWSRQLVVASLLHDAGSPPFSHLSEHFLQDTFGMNGEDFLLEVLQSSETMLALTKLGLNQYDILNLVTGRVSTAEVLHGSIDIDNVDNVARYNWAIGCPGPRYDGLKIARSFVWTGAGWALDATETGTFEALQGWQEARKVVYGAICSEPQLGACMMIYRALEIAFCEK